MITRVLGIRRDGQKVLLAVLNMGGESEAAFRGLLDDLIGRGLTAPSFVIIDGAAGLEKALGLVWPDALMQRCTVHKHRNLLAHAPERLHEEVSADYNDMIYAGTPKEIEKRRKSFIRKWRLKRRAVADSLEDAGDRLFTFSRLQRFRTRRTAVAQYARQRARHYRHDAANLRHEFVKCQIASFKSIMNSSAGSALNAGAASTKIELMPWSASVDRLAWRGGAMPVTRGRLLSTGRNAPQHRRNRLTGPSGHGTEIAS